MGQPRADNGVRSCPAPSPWPRLEPREERGEATSRRTLSWAPSLGPVMILAGGGVEAKLRNDSSLLVAPFDRAEIERGLDRLKSARRMAGWRRAPPRDRVTLLEALDALARFTLDCGAEEVKINPILVCRDGAAGPLGMGWRKTPKNH